MLQKPDNSQVLIITSFCLANQDCNQSHNTHPDTQHGAEALLQLLYLNSPEKPNYKKIQFYSTVVYYMDRSCNKWLNGLMYLTSAVQL